MPRARFAPFGALLVVAAAACGSTAHPSPGVPKAKLTPTAELRLVTPMSCMDVPDRSTTSTGSTEAVGSTSAPSSSTTSGRVATSSTTTSHGCPVVLQVTRPGQVDLDSGAILRSVPYGTVLQVNNASGEPQRLVATTSATGTTGSQVVFDTGRVDPGATTIVVLQNPGRLTISSPTAGTSTTLIVDAQPKA
jgi:hypothetical protein